MSDPLVTLGVPVRNGGEMLRAALDAILAQDYPNIEVIISDNCSSDETPEIAADFARRHPNARIVRQPEPLPAFSNFMWLVDHAMGEYFAWCAHDDLRSSDFVSSLVRGFEQEPDVLLCFGDMEITQAHGEPGQMRPYDFASMRSGPIGRMRKQALMQCFHIYGLWRTEALRHLPKVYCSWWPDLPLMMAAAWRGKFKHVAGTRFVYLEVHKSNDDRAIYQDYATKARSKVANFASLATTCFRAISIVGGTPIGMLAALFVIEKNARQLIPWIARRLSQHRAVAENGHE